MTIESWIDEQLVAFEVPGAAVAVVKDGEIVLCKGFGLADRDAGTPITNETSLAIGSVTKSFTAAAVGSLVDEGLIEWDKPVREYLPEFRLYDNALTDRVTPRDLLSHRTGLPRHEFVWYGNDKIPRADAVKLLRHLEPNRDLRQVQQYNNLMFMTAGHLCEAVTGSTWEDVVRDRLLKPLGMDSTTFSAAEAAKAGSVALGYQLRDDVIIDMPYYAGTTTGPAGAIYASLDDMLVWLRLHLGGGVLDGERVLSEATIREVLRPQMVSADAPIFPEAVSQAYGLGWGIATYRGHKYVHHGGNIDGFSAHVGMLPDDRIGIVFLANRDATTLPPGTTYHVFDELLGLEPINWGERVLTYERSWRQGTKAAKARVERRNGPPAHPLEEYAGTYSHPAYGPLTITVGGDNLIPSFHDMELSLTHRHFEVWDLMSVRFIGMRFPVVFETDLEGYVSAVHVGWESTVEAIRMERAADAALTDPDRLAALVGRYTMGAITLTIASPRPDALTAQTTGGNPVPLVASRGTTFKVKGQEATTLTFTLDADGRPTEVVMQPAGVFTRVDPEA